MDATVKVKSWKVEVLPTNETEWVSNGLTFETAEAAEKYGSDLFSRWFGIREYRVVLDVPCKAFTAEQVMGPLVDKLGDLKQ